MSKSQEDLVRKIRALRAKANDKSTTEAEAAAFAAKVQELLTTHGLDVSDLGSDKTNEEEQVAGKIHKWDGSPARQVMLRAVCRFYMCTAVGPGHKGGVWTIVGKPTNVMVALDMFDYLLGTVIRLSNEYARRTAGSNKIDWRRGCMARLAERLEELRAAELEKPKEYRANGNPGNLPALFTGENQLVRNFIQEKMTTTKGKPTTLKQGHDAAHGRAAADTIGMHRQVGGGSGRLAIGKK